MVGNEKKKKFPISQSLASEKKLKLRLLLPGKFYLKIDLTTISANQ